jgi:hypothetical protein
MKKKKKTNRLSKIQNKLTKQNIIYLIILIVDILFTIYVARKNIINYVTIDSSKKIYLGDKHNLFLGRNYITLVTTFIVYIYYIILNKFYFKEKISIKKLILVLLILLLINCLVFYLFTVKVY